MKLASILLVLALVTVTQAGVILSEDFEGGELGYGVNGYNGWSGSSEVEFSGTVIDSGQSAGWSTGSWPAISKGFSYTAGVGERYVFTATVYAPGTGNEYADIRLLNSSDPANQMQGVTIGYGDMQFGVINTASVVKVTPQPTYRTDVMFILDGTSSEFYYRAHGDADWISVGGFTDLGWSISDYDQIQITGHGGFSGGVDSLVLTAVPEPATMSLLAMGAVAGLLRRKLR